MGLQKMYRTAIGENFPETLSLVLGDVSELSGKEEIEKNTIKYKKVKWAVGGETYGMRYGTNPNQPCAFYRREKTPIQTLCNMDFLKMGKGGPSQTNLQDIDRGCHILKYFTGRPAVSIHKHINPCGFAVRREEETLEDIFLRGWQQDLRSAFGSVVNFNVPVDVTTAERIMETREEGTKYYVEAITAPAYEPGCLDIFNRRKDIRVIRLTGVGGIYKFEGDDTHDIFNIWVANDGSWSLEKPFLTKIRSASDLQPAEHMDEKKGINVRSDVQLPKNVAHDCVDAWHILSNIRSNGILFYKEGGIVAVGTGEQERVGAVEQAIHKAKIKLEDRLIEIGHENPQEVILATKGGLKDSVLASDGFFPYKDNIDAVADFGIKAIIQPGGSVKDYEIIKACNEYKIAMVFTGERCFSHF